MLGTAMSDWVSAVNCRFHVRLCPAKKHGQVAKLGCTNRLQVKLDQFTPCIDLADRPRLFGQVGVEAMHQVVDEGIFPRAGLGDPYGQHLEVGLQQLQRAIEAESLSRLPSRACLRRLIEFSGPSLSNVS